ncbi:MAG: DUF357 domain-containing protein [Methanoregula sp.]|nr:DUF357 domain-containing protein [Methanoregula sp.]
MNIEDCQSLFTKTLSVTRIVAPEDTALNKIAASVLEMAQAYESDGITFFKSDDPVNALAGFYYGLGWLHFGLSSGLLISKEQPGCPFLSPQEVLPSRFRIKLEEKTNRYAYLLDTARSSVACVSEPATTSHDFARRILAITALYAGHGDSCQKSGFSEDAIASFSYGHGWLDAGVTTGFIYIVAHRELFTV